MRVNRRNACGGALEKMDWCKHRLRYYGKAPLHWWIFFIKGNQMQVKQYLNLVLFSQHVYGWMFFLLINLGLEVVTYLSTGWSVKMQPMWIGSTCRAVRWNSPCSSTASFFCSDSLIASESGLLRELALWMYALSLSPLLLLRLLLTWFGQIVVWIVFLILLM